MKSHTKVALSTIAFATVISLQSYIMYQLSICTLIDPPICGVLDPLKTVFFVLKQSDYFLLCAPRPV